MKKLFSILLIAATLCGCSNIHSISNSNGIKYTEPTTYNNEVEVTEANIGLATDKETSLEPLTPIDEINASKDLSYDAGSYREMLECSNGQVIEYIVRIPENATIGMPLIFSLHGQGEIGMSLPDNSGISNVANDLNENRFIIVQPSAKRVWHQEEQIKETMELLDHVIETYQAGEDKIILTGCSLGAMATWQYAENFTDRWAAIIPVSNKPNVSLDKLTESNIPVMAIWSNWDTEANVYGMKQAVKEMSESGREAEVVGIEVERVEHKNMGTAGYTEEVFDWMYKQVAHK